MSVPGDRSKTHCAEGSFDLCWQMREETAKRQHDSAAHQLRTCTDHRCTMDALLNPDGVPPDFLSSADTCEAVSLAQQPWYRVLYIAQVKKAFCPGEAKNTAFPSNGAAVFSKLLLCQDALAPCQHLR
jgi:hypothetical protein